VGSAAVGDGLGADDDGEPVALGGGVVAVGSSSLPDTARQPANPAAAIANTSTPTTAPTSTGLRRRDGATGAGAEPSGG
jgi:hypothetical protein